ncbi:NAD(P)H dehydrogenase (quinone) [Chitinophaga ginsengisegetis]|uniref:NAD(P)H dehydrogenase (Quinone) n=1 Tax=Chitinophaga ginsengisegetis TaxID=393003 RepID=A0A1T5P9X2_9BACT|nr:NAD(P)H-dependent oxidoreductase [Chitinophaga ginsengisegetis]MDR6568945.1 NAD(P)H dehydrogenase (quinone) [Chitinophaga ginsengisegetis]MDR6649026.1 NAD(P)H dehydrogenase (quinone) [Chitinophaga ginsengisegetis]MDR6655026.1 NAD(P)H dehydrogenase (quinone) [Chitinophaga ginsengisegetis]SKD09524.1 NAD(P)H dehydrogenase (quinone) [Chitinophaga ginsengisegetis]
MKILIVYAHPEPKSMNGAMFNTAITTLQEAGHEVQTSDLYAMQFNPTSDRTNFTSVYNDAFFKQQLEEQHASRVNGFAADVAAEQEKIAWCDVMIWQFPMWWFSIPAILKGWVDRVFAMGTSYGNGHIYETGIYTGKKAMLSLTIGGPEDAYISGGLHGDLENILKPIHRGIFQFTGFSVLEPQVIHGPARMSPEERALALEKWTERLTQIAEEAAIELTAY